MKSELSEVLSLDSVHAGERLRAMRAVRLAESTLEIGGGIACRRACGAWLNVAAGMGLASPITPGEAAEIVEWFAEAGKDARVEVADRACGLDVLSELGFRLWRLVSILSLGVKGFAPSVRSDASSVSIERLVWGDAEAVEACSMILTSAFTAAGQPVRDSDVQANRECLSHRDATAFVAKVGHRCVGVGLIDVAGTLASLWGAAVAPEHRGVGIQRKLLEVRIQHAIEQGAEVAFVETDSGGPTHRNAARLGFALAYSRAVLIRPLRHDGSAE